MTPDVDDPARRELLEADACRVAHVSPETLRQWAHRKLITAVNPEEPKERRRYLELDVLDAEAKTRRRPRAERLAEEAARDQGFGQAA